MTKREIIRRRPDGYIEFKEGYYCGLMDKDGNVIIDPDDGYHIIKDFVDGIAIGLWVDKVSGENGFGLLDERGKKISDFKYKYISPFVDGYYLTVVDSKKGKNLLRSDGSDVFKESYDNFEKYHLGYVIGVKSTQDENNGICEYRWLLHVSGKVVLPLQNDNICWAKDYKDIFYHVNTFAPTKYDYDDLIVYDLPQFSLFSRRRFGRIFLNGTVGVELNVELPERWVGIDFSICEECIYCRGIDSNGNHCGRLFSKSFHNRRIKNRCEFRKSELNEPSRFEAKAIERWKNIVRLKDPFRDFRQLVNNFIEEYLDGDIDRLASFDLRQLNGTERYGEMHGSAFEVCSSELVRALAALAFADIAKKDVMFDKIRGTLVLSPAQLIKEDLWGEQFDDSFLMPTYFHHNDKPSVTSRILPCAAMCNTIGNLYLLPSSLNEYRYYRTNGQFLIDHTLADLHKVLTGKIHSKQMEKVVSDSRDFFEPYHGTDGWKKLMQRWLMIDLVDRYYNPKSIFEDIDLSEYTSAITYYSAVERCITLCHEIIPPRTQQILQRLKNVL